MDSDPTTAYIYNICTDVSIVPQYKLLFFFLQRKEQERNCHDARIERGRGAAAAARTSLTKGCYGGVVFLEGERYYVRARVWAWRVGDRFVCVRYMTMQGRGRLLLAAGVVVLWHA
jgi:hypothetical protein